MNGNNFVGICRKCGKVLRKKDESKTEKLTHANCKCKEMSVSVREKLWEVLFPYLSRRTDEKVIDKILALFPSEALALHLAVAPDDPILSKELQNIYKKSEGYDLIMDRLVVEVPCGYCHNGIKGMNIGEDGHTEYCGTCQGNGYTTRTVPTPEEVRELIEVSFKVPLNFTQRFDFDERGWCFLLKSGNKLRMEGEEK